MRKIKAHIKTSPDRNLLYKIYRDTLEANVPAPADLLALLTPIALIREAEIAKKAFLITEEEAAVDVTAIITSAFVPYLIKHTMLKSLLHSAIIKIDYANGTSLNFTVKFNNAEVVVSVKDQLNADYDLSSTFDFTMRNMVKVKDTYLADATKVRISYYTEVIEIVDHSDPQIGVTYNGPVPLGKITATLAKIAKTVTQNGAISPYLELMPLATTAVETYCYRLLAFDSSNNISDSSELMTVQLQQPLAELTYKLQTCLNTLAPIPLWTDTGVVVKSGVAIDYGKFGTPEYTTVGNILVNKVVPTMGTTSVLAVYSSTAGSVTLSFNNPWTYDIYTARKTKAFRLQASFDSTASVNVISSVLDHEAIDIDIDVANIKRCTLVSPTDPFDESSAILIGRFCLNNGRLFNKLQSDSTAPVLVSELNSGATSFNGEIAVPVVPMYNYGSVDKCTIVDNEVVAGQYYKYSITLIDVMDGSSTPTYKDVITTTV